MSWKSICTNKDFCGTACPNQKDNILKFDHFTSCIIYADLES